MGFRVISNYHVRRTVNARDLPASARKDFPYLDWETPIQPEFVSYRGHWYDLSVALRAPYVLIARGWDGMFPQTPNSGVCFRFFDVDGYELDDAVIVGRFYWDGD